jgi:hypothetical protein
MPQGRMIPRPIPYETHPQMLTGVQIDRRDSSIRRLYERKALRPIGAELQEPRIGVSRLPAV